MLSGWKCYSYFEFAGLGNPIIAKNKCLSYQTHSFDFLSVFSLQKILNDALMGILRVRDLISPPYISTQPSLNVHKISNSDQFVIVASDGLFDFFSNDEAVQLVESYTLSNPFGDPAKFLVEQLVARAADSAGHFPRSHAKFNFICMNINFYILFDDIMASSDLCS